jgi:uncharacterized membrane protein YtjA (UPF0391 family)
MIMAEQEEKYPWESKTELAAFVGLVVNLIASFNLMPGVVWTAEQTAGVASILFVVVMIVRKIGTGGKIVLKKTE